MVDTDEKRTRIKHAKEWDKTSTPNTTEERKKSASVQRSQKGEKTGGVKPQGEKLTRRKNSSSSLTGLFRLKFGMGCSAGSVGEEGGGGRLAGTCSLGASLEDYPLFLLDMRPLKPNLGFRSMPSSSTS